MGDSSYTRADFGGLSSGQADFALAYKGLQDTLDDLQKDLESSLARWDGAAKGEYQRAKAEWNSAAQNMAMVLNSLGNVIGEAHGNYSSAEKTNSSIWAG